MAKSKSQKEAMLAEYVEWLAKSQAVVLVEYSGLKMKDLDAIRAKARENGGEFHIVKNTLAKIALEKAGYSVPADFAEKSTAIGFAFNDAAGFTKALRSDEGHGSRQNERWLPGCKSPQLRPG